MRAVRLLSMSLGLIIVLAAMPMVSFAQEADDAGALQTATTVSGISLRVPAEWAVYPMGDETLMMVGEESVGTIIITLPADIPSKWGMTPQTLDELVAYMMGVYEVDPMYYGELYSAQHAPGMVLMQPYESAFEIGAMIGIQFYDGRFATITVGIVDFGFELFDALLEQTIPIIDTITFPTPNVLLQPEQMANAMPSGQVVLRNGAALTIPEGWRIADADQPIGFTVTLVNADGSVRVTLEAAEDPALTVDYYRREVAPALAEAACDDTFDPLTHFTLLSLADNRQVLTYDAVLHRPDDARAPALWYQLLATEYGVLQVTARAAEEALLSAASEDVLALLGSYDVSGVQVEAAP